MRGVYQRGKIWYITYYANGKRIRGESIGESKKLAEIVLQKRKVEIAEGKFLDKKQGGNIRFEDFVDEFYRLHCMVNKKPSSGKADKSLLRTLEIGFKNKNLGSITPIMLEEYKSLRLKTGKP